MADRETILKIGEVWDQISTGWRLVFSNIFAAIIGTTITLTHWFSTNLASAKYEREVGRLEREKAQLEGELVAVKDERDRKGIPTYTIELLSDEDLMAELPKPIDDNRTMDEFANDQRDHRQKYADKTSIQRPDFYELNKNRRFRWEGYVKDVDQYSESDNIRVNLVSLNDPSNSFSCSFDADKYRDSLFSLSQGDRIKVEGVLFGYGLRKCHLVSVHPATTSASSSSASQ